MREKNKSAHRRHTNITSHHTLGYFSEIPVKKEEREKKSELQAFNCFSLFRSQ